MNSHNIRIPDQLSVDLHHAVQFTQLGEGAIQPKCAHDGDAGYDLYTFMDTEFYPGQFIDVATGIAVKLPDGVFGRITNRSSTFRKWRLNVIEGIIDNGYTGHLFIGVVNLNPIDRVFVPAGTRLAQIILQQIQHYPWVKVDKLPETDRGSKGFGSSGV